MRYLGQQRAGLLPRRAGRTYPRAAISLVPTLAVHDQRNAARGLVGPASPWSPPYRWAGPPYIHWYELERSRALLRELGESEPQWPPFDCSKVKPIPYEAEIRTAIAKL